MKWAHLADPFAARNGAERMAARLLHEGIAQNREVLRYLNRMSDVLFVLARYEESAEGVTAQRAKAEQAEQHSP